MFAGIVGPALALGVVAGTPAAQDRGAPPDLQRDGARRSELLNMVRQDCGSCHGLTMKGGLGPPLLPEALSAKDPDALAYIILYGKPGTPMPPWKDFVSESEARWIVDQLRQGLPDGR